MAVITQALWTASTGITVTGADATSIDTFASAVSEALTRKCAPIAIEPKTLTLFACDAPLGNILDLPLRPCRSITALYLRWGANGDSSTLTTADLLTNFTDYYLPVDDAISGINRAGMVYRRNRGIWGFERRYSLDKLAPATDPNRGAIFVSGTFGPTAVSAVVQEAAARAVTLLYHRRTSGAAYSSESFGGYSYSNAGPFTAEGAVNSPEVTSLLMAAGVLPIHVG
jgi:hypothetical protein